jgi:uncharacterized alpha-E superfamily protein
LIFDTSLPRSIAYCLGEMEAMIELLRRRFGLRNASISAGQIEAMTAGLAAASQDGHLLEKLHSFNDRVQLGLIALTDELGQAFFGHARPAKMAPAQSAMSQTQSQTLTAH